ncbi:MAG: peptidyl-prolyl cis-trans isomerase [Phenylobacterium sp.]|uniref:peptidylprolyl isomerase n=1 Tax=Phenylobacterium sp. TaxID=1871053 RepID=UPI00391C3CB8
MLAATRKFAKSWVAAILIGLLVISFAIFGINDVFRGNFSNDVIVSGSRKVSTADFKREFDNYRSNLEQQAGQPITTEMAVENRLDARLLEELAYREAFGELLRRAGVRPSDKLLTEEIRKIPAFFDQISGRFDRTMFQQRLGEAGLTPEKFDVVMRDQIAESHAVSAIANGLRIPRAYAALGAVYETEARDIGYFTIAPTSVPQPTPPTDAQLTQFMNENAERLRRPEQRILTLVTFTPQQVASNLPIDEEEVRKRYAFRKDTLSRPETRSLVQIPAKDAAAAQAIAARLNQGEDPQAVARSLGVDALVYTDRPRTAVADPRVGEAAFGLQANQVSTVQGALGLAVVKVTKITPGQEVTLEQIRPQIEAELRHDAAAERVYALTQAYEDAHADGASLAEAAKAAGVPSVTVGPVTAQGAGPNGQPVAGLNPKVLETAFTLPAEGESDLVELGEGAYFAVRVERVIPAALPPLDEVKPQLTQIWMMRELVRRLEERAEGFAERLRKGESLETVAAAAGARVARATSLDRRNAGENQELSRDALVKAFGAKSGEVFTAQGNTPGFVIAKVEAIRAPDGAQLAEMTEGARPQMSMAFLREMGEATRRAAREEVKVRVYPNQARAALGLPPLTPAEKSGGAGKAETSK